VWNALPGLRDCLRSIEPEVVDGFAEVIAVDNASPDESVQVVEASLPQAKVIRTEANLAFGGGVNRSWPHVRGGYWMLLNPDAIVPPGGLQKLVAWMDEHPDVGVASPAIADIDGTNERPTTRALPSAGLVTAELLRLHRLLPQRVRGRIFQGPYWTGGDNLEAGWVPGTAMIVRREAAEHVGLPDPSFFLYGEDIDWCWRMRRAGWRVGYCSGVVVRHEESATNLRSYGRSNTLRRMAQSEFDAVRHARGGLRARLYVAALVVAITVECVHPRRARKDRTRARSQLRAWRSVARRSQNQ